MHNPNSISDDIRDAAGALREDCKNGLPIGKASQLLTVKREGIAFLEEDWLPQPLTEASR